MVQHSHVRHLHKKKQKTAAKEPFDYVVYFFMIATPLFELPQAYIIHSTQTAQNISPYTWGFFFIGSIVWLTYSIRNKLKPLIVMYSGYLVVEASIVAGIIMYA